MSYDLYFVPAEAGAQVDAVQAYLENEDRKPAAATGSLEELARALQRVNPALQRLQLDHARLAELDGVSVEEARREHDYIELNGADATCLQITLFADQTTIAEVGRCAGVLVEQGRYRIFDPQLERVVTSFDELERELLETYAGVSRRMPEIVASSQTQKPWWRFW